jgi:hypothetical protein
VGRWERALSIGVTLWIGACLPCSAQPADMDLDTEHMFGFSEGSDIGRPGQADIELETIGRFGRQGDGYSAITSTAGYKYPLSRAWRIAGQAAVSRFSVSGVPGMDDRSQFAFDQLSGEVRYRALDRRTAPLGLTMIATPFYGFVDGSSGTPADRYGASLVVAADRALVPDTLFAALNLGYGIERSRDRASGVLSDSSSLAFQAAAAGRLAPWLFVGGEVRYLRTYDGLGLDALAGQAVYAGPTLFAPIRRGFSISAAWNLQAWGQGRGPGALDLVNFERQQAKLRLEIDF